MTKKILSFIFIIIYAFSFTSCTTFVSDQFPEFTTKLTLNSILVEGNSLQVHVSLAENIDSTEIEIVEDAEVVLYADGEYLEQLTHLGNGVYESTHIINSLTAYVCSVKTPDFTEIICTQTLPRSSEILNIEHINIAGIDEEGISYPAIEITFENDPDILSYYEIVIWLLGTSPLNPFYKRSADVVEIVDPIILSEGLPLALFSNEEINDSSYTMVINYKTGGKSSFNNGIIRTSLHPFIVELRTVTYDYYRYKKQLYLYQNGLLPDGITSPMNNSSLYSNIKKGFGIFAGYDVCETDTITPNREGYYE